MHDLDLLDTLDFMLLPEPDLADLLGLPLRLDEELEDQITEIYLED